MYIYIERERERCNQVTETSDTSPAPATHKTSETYGDLCKVITSETKRIMPMTSNCIVALNLRSGPTVPKSDEPPRSVSYT